MGIWPNLPDASDGDGAAGGLLTGVQRRATVQRIDGVRGRCFDPVDEFVGLTSEMPGLNRVTDPRST